MKIKLSPNDVLQLSRAIKGGCLDTDKIVCLQQLVKWYNPPEKNEVSDDDMMFYLDCLKMGLGFIPNSRESFSKYYKNELSSNGKHRDTLIEWLSELLNGNLYNMLIKDIFMGMIALRAIGGEFVEPCNVKQLHETLNECIDKMDDD